MNISSLGNIPNIAKQITIGTPQAGFRCNSRAAVTFGSDRLNIWVKIVSY